MLHACATSGFQPACCNKAVDFDLDGTAKLRLPIAQRRPDDTTQAQRIQQGAFESHISHFQSLTTFLNPLASRTSRGTISGSVKGASSPREGFYPPCFRMKAANLLSA